jgi:LuxR family maltose regulon positive regulatory protein
VRLQDRVKATLLQGMAYHRIGDTTNALSKLEAALQKAEPAGLLRSFIEEGKGAAELLSLYLDYRQRNLIGHSTLVSLPYVKKLLLLMRGYMDEISISTTLTKQELRIVQMVGKGMSNKQIAEQNQVKVETVKSHLKNIYRKLDVNTR